MTILPPSKLKRYLRWSAAIVLGACLGAFLFAWSGIYNVAASSGHWAVVDWALRFGMRNSVETRAKAVALPRLDDPNLVPLGAAHFQISCAFCHGSPDGPMNSVTEKMLPPPPNLTTSMRPWKDEELFWIVQHGIKYTGMPGWVAIEREDEIGAMVALLKRLPTLDRETYRELAFGPTRAAVQQSEAPAIDKSGRPTIALCARCHGDERGSPSSALVPRLHGQSDAFLATALRNYARGLRRSGIMQPIAADLDEQEIDRLSAFYAKLKPLEKAPPPADDALTARGRMIATEGDAARGVPACTSCHGRDALAIYPRLEGQSAAYMAGQLRVWKAGHNSGSDGAAIMAPIAQRLDDRDLDAAAAYFSSLLAQPSASVPR
jgi:cytochrome c553